MRRRLLLLLLAGLVALTACTSSEEAGSDAGPEDGAGSAPTTAAPVVEGLCDGTSVLTTDVSGQDRRYFVQTPPDWDGTTPLPVVYVLHGLGGQADTNLAYTGLATQAEEHDFIVVAPQAENAERRWDFRSSVDDDASDLGFLRLLMDEVAQEPCVDADQQYAAGISNGSAMILAMACSGEFPVRAYGGVAAMLYEPQCASAPPVSMVYFHGTADRVVPFEGGPTPIEPVRPTLESLAGWAGHSGCGTEPTSQEVGEDVERLTWLGCDDARMEAYIVEGGGHTWPGALPLPTLGTTTTTISAAEVMTDFFGLADRG